MVMPLCLRKRNDRAEVFRLSDFTRDDFLKIMIDGAATYNRAYVNQNIK